MKKTFLRISSVLFALILPMVISLTAVGASVTGPTYASTVYGYTYSYYSEAISFGDGSISATTTSICSSTAPIGYMGVAARLYSSSGALLKASSISYNREATHAFGIQDSSYNTSSYCFSKGFTEYYNGNGYTTKTCASTPNISGYSNTHTYQINARGLSYGSDYYCETSNTAPDLIRVIGINGNEGYVYSAELETATYLNLNDLNDVKNYIVSEEYGNDRVLPVYSEDGFTIIDSFIIDNGLDSEILVHQ